MIERDIFIVNNTGTDIRGIDDVLVAAALAGHLPEEIADLFSFVIIDGPFVVGDRTYLRRAFLGWL